MSATSDRPSVLAMGYTALDVIVHDGTVAHAAGGTAANVAANLAYLGWDASLIARVGHDAPARRIVNDLRSAGVGVDLVERDGDVQTPVVLHQVIPPAHRFLFTCPRCGRRFPRYRPISEGHLEARILGEGGPTGSVFFFDRPSRPAIRVAEAMRDRGVLVVFEPGSRGAPRLMLEAASMAQVIKVSHERRQSLDAQVLASREGQLQIETLGADGVRYRFGDERWTMRATRAKAVIDSAGAGDWFTAGLLVELAPSVALGEGSAVRRAVDRAQAFAALSCQFVGARSIARFPRDVVEDAARRVLAGQDVVLSSLRVAMRSRAAGVCNTCLGPDRHLLR